MDESNMETGTWNIQEPYFRELNFARPLFCVPSELRVYTHCTMVVNSHEVTVEKIKKKTRALI